MTRSDLAAEGLRPVAGPPHDGGHALHDELPLRAGLALVPGNTLVPENR